MRTEFVALDPTIWQNDKVLRVADALDENEDFVALSFIALLTYARERQPDGVLEDLGVRALRRVLRWHGKCSSARVIEEMLAVSFLSSDPLRITNFMVSHRRLLESQRQAQRRGSEPSKRDATVTDRDSSMSHSCLKRDRVRMDKDKDKEIKSVSAFDAFWIPYPKKVDKQAANVVFDRLNDIDRAAAILAATAYGAAVAACEKDLQYEPGPAKWLRGRRWEEWAVGSPPGYSPNGNGDGSPVRVVDAGQTIKFRSDVDDQGLDIIREILWDTVNDCEIRELSRSRG
jgi:hypothetical protein